MLQGEPDEVQDGLSVALRGMRNALTNQSFTHAHLIANRERQLVEAKARREVRLPALIWKH